jgi:hypothetical protein
MARKTNKKLLRWDNSELIQKHNKVTLGIVKLHRKTKNKKNAYLDLLRSAVGNVTQCPARVHNHVLVRHADELGDDLQSCFEKGKVSTLSLEQTSSLEFDFKGVRISAC